MATQSPLLETVLGDRYRIERELGRGGMAIVYLAHDLRQDRQVAVKVLHPDLTVVLGPERFRREIHVATSLSHPHILPVFDAGELDGALYYVMPYVEGESLAAKLHREHQLSVPDAVRIASEVAHALHYAHQRGIVHRDIKPENILLDAEGHAIVADFGIARAISASGEEKLTQTGVTLGTPAYMSPEQAMAEKELDGRSDVYSLGCVLYEALAGHPPFIGPTAQAIIARQMVGEVPSLIVVRGTIPEEVEDAVMRALAKVPADRFATALEFAEALEESMRSGGRSLGRAERRARTRRAGGRRWPAWLRFGMPVAALALLGLGAGAWRSRALRASGATVSTDAAGLSPKRIAVLYFDDLTPSHSLGHLADGFTESLIGDLAAVPGLEVISANGVAPFRGDAVSPDSVAHALSAGTLVRGSVEENGTTLHVTVRLIDGASGADFKRASFDTPVTASLAVRDSLVQQVASFLRSRLGEEIQLRVRRQGTRSVDAWSLAQRAEKAMKSAQEQARASDSVGAVRELDAADSLLVRASIADPRWTEPLVMRGQVALHEARYAITPVVSAQRARTGLALADSALAIDARSADALELRGTARWFLWVHHLAPDPREAATLLGLAEADLKQALSIAPERASAWSTLASVYYQKPDLVEATLATRRAYEADAYLANADEILWQLYTTSYNNEEFVDAIHWCDEGRRRFPRNPAFVRCQLWLFTTNAKPPDADAGWRLVEQLHALTPARSWPYESREAQMLVAAALGRAGRLDSARHVLERARADASIDPDRELLGTEAFIRTLFGDRDEALRLIKVYLTAKPEHREGLAVSQSWWWRDLRSDPRFRELTGMRR